MGSINNDSFVDDVKLEYFVFATLAAVGEQTSELILNTFRRNHGQEVSPSEILGVVAKNPLQALKLMMNVAKSGPHSSNQSEVFQREGVVLDVSLPGENKKSNSEMGGSSTLNMSVDVPACSNFSVFSNGAEAENVVCSTPKLDEVSGKLSSPEVDETKIETCEKEENDDNVIVAENNSGSLNDAEHNQVDNIASKPLIFTKYTTAVITPFFHQLKSNYTYEVDHFDFVSNNTICVRLSNAKCNLFHSDITNLLRAYLQESEYSPSSHVSVEDFLEISDSIVFVEDGIAHRASILDHDNVTDTFILRLIDNCSRRSGVLRGRLRKMPHRISAIPSLSFVVQLVELNQNYGDHLISKIKQNWNSKECFLRFMSQHHLPNIPIVDIFDAEEMSLSNEIIRRASELSK